MSLLMGCNANVHNEIKGSSITKYLFDCLVKENLEMFNWGDEPIFVTKVRKKVLDITFGSLNCDRLGEV